MGKDSENPLNRGELEEKIRIQEERIAELEDEVVQLVEVIKKLYFEAITH